MNQWLLLIRHPIKHVRVLYYSAKTVALITRNNPDKKLTPENVQYICRTVAARLYPKG